MKLGFEESQSPYESGSQSARFWTEKWVEQSLYCPNCGNLKLSKLPNNQPVADFKCSACIEEFELKSQKTKFGSNRLLKKSRVLAGVSIFVGIDLRPEGARRT